MDVVVALVVVVVVVERERERERHTERDRERETESERERERACLFEYVQKRNKLMHVKLFSNSTALVVTVRFRGIRSEKKNRLSGIRSNDNPSKDNRSKFNVLLYY